MTTPPPSDTLPNRPGGSGPEPDGRGPASSPGATADPVRAQLEQALAGTYEIEREIGRGGMGIVYLARDVRLKRPVAVKLLPPELAYRPEIRSRFLREAQTAAQLNHPNIVPIYTVQEADQLVFFVMGYVRGENLAHRLEAQRATARGAIPAEEARRILREVAEALAYAHARQVIHRDIKPDNIVLDTETDSPSIGRAMVTDFGIARALTDTTDPRLTTTGTAIGTPAYMSPEQCAGERAVDGRSDLYSLGVVGYQMLCGALPFSATNTPAMLVKHLSEAPTPLRDRCMVPQDLHEIIMRCLAKDPNDRFASAAELVATLDGRRNPAQQALDRLEGTGGPLPRRSVIGIDPLSGPPHAGSRSTSTPFEPAAPAIGEIARWEAPPVRRYRRKMVSWMVTSAAFIPASVFIHSDAFLMISAFWGIGIAIGYGKLWDKGYDWRDVFRQPRDQSFVDLVGEKIDDTRALFDPVQRARMRERLRARRRRQPGLLAPSPPVLVDEEAALYPVVHEANALRSDIHRLVDTLPRTDRDLLPNVIPSADALVTRVEMLATNIDELARADVPGIDAAIDREIAQLKSESSVSLDDDREERRRRRLAQLERQRISLRDLRERHAIAADKLERCLRALRTMRLDLIRLSAGAETVVGARSLDSVTQLAEQAVQLGREVDAVLYAQHELHRVLDS